MITRGLLAAVSLIVGTVGCAPPTGDDEALDSVPPSEDAPDAEDAVEPLDFTVDALDIVHGSLRLDATMVDGAADVSVHLGGDCDPREVGGGVATLSRLVWALGDNDVAAAIGCGLVVRARVHDGAGFVNKVAELDVTADVGGGDDSGDEAPALQGLTASEAGVSIIFAPVRRSARLTTGDSVLPMLESESEEEDSPQDPVQDSPPENRAGRFLVPRIDFARSVLRGRPLYLDGVSFVPSLLVGGIALQSEAPAPEEESEEAPVAE